MKKLSIRIIIAISVVLLISMILIFVYPRSQNPLGIIKTSQQRSDATNYLVEYATKIDTTISNVPISQIFRTVTSKIGTNKKTQVYAKEIVLLQESIEKDSKVYTCYYGQSIEDISCLVMDKPQNLPSQDAILEKLLKSKIMEIKTSKKTVQVGSRELKCDNLDYIFDFSKLTPEITRDILQLVSTSAESNGSVGLESIKEFKLTTCFDLITGLPLESSSSIRYVAQSTNDSISFYQSTTQKATRLDINPLLSEDNFAVPENAKLKVVKGESI